MSRKERRYQQKLAQKEGARAGPAARPSEATALLIGRLQAQAIAFQHAGRPHRALKICKDILALRPVNPDVVLGYAGRLALEIGDHGEAAALYGRAAALRPDIAEVHYNFAGALSQLGRLDEAAGAYRTALALRPDFMPAHHNLGNVLRGLGRTEEAVEAYRRALAVEATAEGERDLGVALSLLGQLDEAIAAWRRSLALPGHRTDLYSNLANALLEQGDAAGALAACERWLALVPASIEGAALQALALNALGDKQGARRLLDFDRFVRVIDFTAPPPGFASLAAFNAALAEHVERHPTLKVPPRDQPTYHHDALQITDELLSPPRGPMVAFETMMRRAVMNYAEGVPRQPPHPFPEHIPPRWHFGCWATRLLGEGNLEPHIHFTGYIGGVYYPLLPDVVKEEGRGEAGWFELGRAPERLACNAEPLTRRIQPREGRLILFPGYFFHATIPFTAPQQRISIAFDVMPTE
ncbi:MAG TPA: tetratricopeptide repeat protein [Stellaceae bacterium]|nr:tetratricopeptide repeat protein [Stellaceae bacterium]